MTALAGYFAFGEQDPAPLCLSMLAAQADYGKQTAVRTAGELSMGRRLWPLLPEDRFDQGPLTSANGQLLLCADARIDNRAELLSALALPQPPDQLCDVAIILAAYERWGNAVFAKLYGAFAIAIWDGARRTLTLARDPLGERPLHYHVGRGFAAFASMPKGLHAISTIPYAARTAAMADFLALMPETGPESFFEHVDRVQPGHQVAIGSDGTICSQSYWQPSLDPLHLPRDSDYEDAMREALDRAVRDCLRRTHGAIGTHLSGGLDSGSVAATAARLVSHERITAFTAVPADGTVGSRDSIADEWPLAAATAAAYPNIDHVRVQTGGQSPLAGMDKHFRVFERPILNPCNAVWSDAINDMAAARGISVMLTGQMGNMSISHSGLQQLNMFVRAGALPSAARLFWQLTKRGFGWRGLAAQAIGPFLPPALWATLTRAAGAGHDLADYSALRPDAFVGYGVADRARERGLDPSYRPWADSKAMRLWVLRRTDLGVYYKGMLAGWGMDMRDPTADRRLIELALRIPERQFILNGIERSLARRALADRLPRAVVAEQRRGLQAADWHLGFANAQAAISEELAAQDRNPQARAIIDIDRLQQALTEWPNSDPRQNKTAMLYRHAMLRSIAAGHFLRKVGRTN
jgi:asparagine synthase (glutamine-hydrolysing)